MNRLGRNWWLRLWAVECEGIGGHMDELDHPPTHPDVLSNWNPQHARLYLFIQVCFHATIVLANSNPASRTPLAHRTLSSCFLRM